MRERRTYGSVRGLRREPLVYSTAGLTKRYLGWTMDTNRLEQLKRENKKYIRYKQWEENELLQDCLNLLSDLQLLGEEQDVSKIVHLMCKKFPINEYRHIEGAYKLVRDEMDFLPNQMYYILWDDKALPILKCSGKSILKCLDDIFAVSFDTYIFSDNFSEIIHSDATGTLWRYF